MVGVVAGEEGRVGGEEAGVGGEGRSRGSALDAMERVFGSCEGGRRENLMITMLRTTPFCCDDISVSSLARRREGRKRGEARVRLSPPLLWTRFSPSPASLPPFLSHGSQTRPSPSISRLRTLSPATKFDLHLRPPFARSSPPRRSLRPSRAHPSLFYFLK